MAFEILIIAAWFTSLSLRRRLLDRAVNSRRMAPFTARKISHVTGGLWVIPLAAFVSHWYLAAIPITMILAANAHANRRRGNPGRLQERLSPLVGFLLPEILILSLWEQHSHLVVLAVLAMTVGDTAAAYAGIHLGTYRIRWTGKTVEGAVANFICTLAILAAAGYAFFGMRVPLFPVPAAMAAILEAVIPGEWDNPLGIVVVLALLKWPPG
jgi:dolichol kinase